MKTLLAAAAATLLVGAASAGDKEWTKASQAQLVEMARAGVGVWESDDKEMGQDGVMTPGESRVEIAFEDGVLKGRWDQGADGTWDGEWTETYQEGGYMMTSTDMGEDEVKVTVYLADYQDGDHARRADKWTSTWTDGNRYDYKVKMTMAGDTGTRVVKVRPAGSDADWMTVVESEMARVAKAS